MSRVVSVVCTMLILATMLNSVTPVSAQLLPEVIITCDDEGEIDSGSVTRNVIIECTVAVSYTHLTLPTIYSV